MIKNLKSGKKSTCYLIEIFNFFLQNLHNFWLIPFHLTLVNLPTSLTDLPHLSHFV